jgi:hypothetical protein
MRSALGSYSAILRLIPHPYARVEGRIDCSVCGAYLNSPRTDVNILNFERLKWGGVRHTQPIYAALDLEWFSTAYAPEPIKDDLNALRKLLDRAPVLGPSAGPNDLEQAIKGLFASNKPERRVVIDILGLAGVLAPSGLPNFWDTYVMCAERKPPVNKNDWSYPVLWWKGSDGINARAVSFCFPNL